MTFCYYSLPDHVAQCMVLLVYREDCGVRDFCIEFLYDPEILLIRLCLSLSLHGTYFFSPSYSRNDSNVGGAFIVELENQIHRLTSLPLSLPIKSLWKLVRNGGSRAYVVSLGMSAGRGVQASVNARERASGRAVGEWLQPNMIR